MITGSLDPTKVLTIDEVEAGLDLPTMVKNASRAQLFLYSAASFNPHRIHYDRDYAEFEGHADILVHGPLQGAWLTQYLTDWLGPGGAIVNLNWQNRASGFPEIDYEFTGRVVSVRGDLRQADLELSETGPDGTVLMPATATVQLAGD
ncbi:MAG: hydroxyacyl-ACP dehydratase HTD2-like protein with hotdog domain [Candidatus Poriferisodalaceae bacterium]|jgi:hydroxyacyl-ACP dehydratase HTD2-like protein with hotdog domain